MSESVRHRYRRWRLEELLLRHPGLRIIPSAGNCLVLAGAIDFNMQGPNHGPIQDEYAIELRVSADFPEEIAEVRETEGRIPDTFHKLKNGCLCLGAPTALRLHLAMSPTLPPFVDKLIVPYLFSYSYFIKHGEMPFGELKHGTAGILQYLADLFGVATWTGAQEFLRLASMKRRNANKRTCPCKSGRRLGRCHNRRVNNLRDRLGRRWFRQEYSRVLKLTK